MSAHAHREAGRRSVACAILTVSDTRTTETDTSGRRSRELLEAAGHRILAYSIVPDEPGLVRDRVVDLLADADVEVVIVNGGTGLAPRDTTFEAISALLDKTLDGFGELFRSLSFAEIGPAAMLSRAVAGVAGRTIVASLPGSTGAVELALSRLLVPELGHMVRLVRG
jgi:molybdenum cofactor biosynthesis protein B